MSTVEVYVDGVLVTTFVGAPDHRGLGELDALKQERDWWKAMAESFADQCNARLEMARDFHGSWTNDCRCSLDYEARKRGY